VKKIILLSILSCCVLIAGSHEAFARNEKAVQEIRGNIALGGSVAYDIPALKQDDMLFVNVEGISGDLDPLAVLVRPEIDVKTIGELSLDRAARNLPADMEPIDAVTKLLNESSYVWNDDFEGKYAAAFRYRIPSDGSYRLIVRSTAARQTTGDFRLFIGVNAPEVLEGGAKQTKSFVLLDQAQNVADRGIDIGQGTLTPKRSFQYHYLNEIYAGETLYVHAETTSGDLTPVVTLLDFGDKILKTANFSGQQKTAALQFTFTEKAKNCRILVSGKRTDGAVTSGDYRLMIGIDAPEILKGQGERAGKKILKEPIPVKIGIKMHQVTGVDQKSENFGVVATVLMEWQDPLLAFNPERGQERAKMFGGDSFARETARLGAFWPEFTIFNQQGNRWVQNKLAAVFADGRVIYLERFSVTLQAPDFDFRRFPFDKQQFFIRVDCVLPAWLYVFQDMEGYSAVGGELGEEEWVIAGFDTEITGAEAAMRPVSRFNFRFEATRHLNYYLFRIFLPIFIIITVSWVIFFLKDYDKRLDASAGNLLLFIAYNFTISSDLPRLGYMTFMDAILISGFVVTALVVVLSVFLKRMIDAEKKRFVRRIDKYVILFYPVAYIIGVFLVAMLF
jgi:hypothetical protein